MRASRVLPRQHGAKYAAKRKGWSCVTFDSLHRRVGLYALRVSSRNIAPHSVYDRGQKTQTTESYGSGSAPEPVSISRLHINLVLRGSHPPPHAFGFSCDKLSFRPGPFSAKTPRGFQSKIKSSSLHHTYILELRVSRSKTFWGRVRWGRSSRRKLRFPYSTILAEHSTCRFCVLAHNAGVP